MREQNRDDDHQCQCDIRCVRVCVCVCVCVCLCVYFVLLDGKFDFPRRNTNGLLRHEPKQNLHNNNGEKPSLALEKALFTFSTSSPTGA